MFDIPIKVKVKFTLEQALKAQRENRGIPYSFFSLGARWGQVINATLWLLFLRQRTVVPILQESLWVPGLVWTGAENLAPHWDSIPGLSSLYRVDVLTLLFQPTQKYLYIYVYIYIRTCWLVLVKLRCISICQSLHIPSPHYFFICLGCFYSGEDLSPTGRHLCLQLT